MGSSHFGKGRNHNSQKILLKILFWSRKFLQMCHIFGQKAGIKRLFIIFFQYIFYLFAAKKGFEWVESFIQFNLNLFKYIKEINVNLFELMKIG